MKLICLPHFRPTLSRLAVLAAFGLGLSSSAFGVVLNFSGGGGTPLSMTLPSAVSYTITGTGGGSLPPIFIFQGVGNPFLGGFPSVSGSIAFSVNGGAAQAITGANSGGNTGAVVPTDIYLFGAQPGLAIGSTVVLSAGTLTTTANFAGAAPASGDFQTFITSGNGTIVSTFGTTGGGSVPDAGSTTALLGLGLLGLFSFARMSRRVA